MCMYVRNANAMQRNAMQRNAMQRNAMQRNATQCDEMECFAVQCSAVQCSAVQMHVCMSVRACVLTFMYVRIYLEFDFSDTLMPFLFCSRSGVPKQMQLLHKRRDV